MQSRRCRSLHTVRAAKDAATELDAEDVLSVQNVPVPSPPSPPSPPVFPPPPPPSTTPVPTPTPTTPPSPTPSPPTPSPPTPSPPPGCPNGSTTITVEVFYNQVSSWRSRWFLQDTQMEAQQALLLYDSRAQHDFTCVTWAKGAPVLSLVRGVIGVPLIRALTLQLI